MLSYRQSDTHNCGKQTYRLQSSLPLARLIRLVLWSFFLSRNLGLDLKKLGSWIWETWALNLRNLGLELKKLGPWIDETWAFNCQWPSFCQTTAMHYVIWDVIWWEILLVVKNDVLLLATSSYTKRKCINKCWCELDDQWKSAFLCSGYDYIVTIVCAVIDKAIVAGLHKEWPLVLSVLLTLACQVCSQNIQFIV